MPQPLNKGPLLSIKPSHSLAYYPFAPKRKPSWVFCRRLWDFIAQSPKNPGKRRISTHIRSDIEWWRDFLSVFNGVRFFEEARPIFRLYTDASSIGEGGFFIDGDYDWSSTTVDQDKSFMAPVTPAHINILEVEAILYAFKL